MNYYLRQFYDSEIQGPLSLEAINEGLAAGKLSKKWHAAADSGESLKVIEGMPSHNWKRLSAIPGTSVYSPEPEPQQTVSSPGQCLLWAIVLLFVVLALVYAGCSGHRWP